MPNEHTIAENLQRLVNAKDAIATAITAKGGTVAQGDGLEKFPADIASIQGGLEMNVKFTTGNKVIPAYMFYNNHGSTSQTFSSYPIEEVVIGDDITSIGATAFAHCTGLTSVTIGNGVTSIGNNAFTHCTGLTSVTIGNGVTSIGNDAFNECTGLTSVTIPNNVTSIGNYAFYFCRSLTSISIPNSVTSIGDQAFTVCSRLTSVTIGNGITSIGSNAFSSCSNLTTIKINKPQGSVSGAPWGATNATVVWTG